MVDWWRGWRSDGDDDGDEDYFGVGDDEGDEGDEGGCCVKKGVWIVILAVAMEEAVVVDDGVIVGGMSDGVADGGAVR